MAAPSLREIAGTFVRKAWKSIRLRGVWSTLRHSGAKLLGRTQHEYAESLIDTEGRRFDAQHAINTAKTADPGWLGRLTSRNWLHGQAYQPAPLVEVRQALDKLPPEFADAVFIDVGSGKGRIVLVASLSRFRRVIGIEYDRVLHDIAVQNLAAFNATDKQRIELYCLDAVEYEFPGEPLVVFFHHPFDRPIFEIVVRRLESAHREHGQPICVIYLDPKCREAFESSAVFQRHAESSDGVPFVIYTTGSQPG